MSARKSERLLNLLITLLVSRTYVSKERLRQVIAEYGEAPSDDAFEKMFERDKEDLRQLGVPIEVGSPDPLFEDDKGYRIVRSAFELPEIELSPEEAAVVGLAARVWQHAGLASATSDALVKLKAAGVDVDREALNLVQPQLAVDEPTFELIWDCLRTRTPVRFEYRKSEATSAELRHLQPWGVATYRGRWYVVGLDTDRGQPRLFRLSRVQGDVVRDGRPGVYVVPPGTDLRELTSALAPVPQDLTARLLIRRGAALGLRRRTRPVEGEAPQGWDHLEVSFGRDGSLVDEVLGHGENVIVLEPPDLREAVIRELKAVASA
ncbi:MAG TPA: WYL domain-containing protein [Nocardioidaceae bacterium]|nr:WYL domain-containing protein [Nocardioidaceae bacterium]